MAMKIKNILSSIKPSSSAGFTFIELVILTLIMGILSAVALTKSREDTSNFTTSIAVQQVTGDIDYCKSLSFSKNDTITMVFDLENEFYKVYTGQNSARTLITDFPNFVDNKVTFPKFGINSVNLSNLTFYSSHSNAQIAQKELQFLPGGIPFIGGNVHVNSKIITIANETGKWTIN
jgi:Tfp pilus assembly protein FimT